MFAVIVNPVSGGGEAVRLAIRISERIAAMGQRKAACLKRQATATQARQTRAAVEAGCEAVVCIRRGRHHLRSGRGALPQGCDVYVVPGGTGNDFARAFHLPKDPMAAFESAACGRADSNRLRQDEWKKLSQRIRFGLRRGGAGKNRGAESGLSGVKRRIARRCFPCWGATRRLKRN